MLVVVAVSSKNTSLVTSSVGWLARHWHRAACTSARSCSLACRVFFKRETPAVELMPQGRDLDSNAMLGQPRAQLRQRQPALGFNPRAQLRLHCGNAGLAIAAHRQTAAPAFLLKARTHLIYPHAAYLIPARNCRR